jgi:chromosome segregation ATPase
MDIDVARATAERDELLAINKARQRQIAAILEAEQRHAPNGGSNQSNTDNNVTDSAPVKTDYIKLLNQLHNIWDEISKKHEKTEATVRSMTADLDSQDSKGEALASSLRLFQHTIAKSSVDRQGQPLHMKVIERFDVEDAALNAELAEARLQYLTLQSQLDGLQNEIKKKEQLAEGLHLIDFEQLKIENATLNEKIEERNDEIYKLKKKRSSAVEIFTHVREKIYYLKDENTKFEADIALLDEEIFELRNQLKDFKEKRAALRNENNSLKIKQGFIGDDSLVGDYEGKKRELHELSLLIQRQEQQLKQLQSGSSTTSTISKKSKAKPQRGSVTLTNSNFMLHSFNHPIENSHQPVSTYSQSSEQTTHENHEEESKQSITIE